MKNIFCLVTSYFFTFVFLLITFFCGSFFFIMHHHVINFSVLSQYHEKQPSFLLDDEGNQWGRFQADRREPIDGSSLSPHLINAFIAAEDWNFFNHNGISWKGIIRSIIVNTYYGRKAQGASTITQQLVKLLFFDSKKTFKRKIKEQLYAILVEQQFTKEQILQTYLNYVCFGCGIYGVEAASQRFWSKHVHELTIDQAATLAAIICSPARYCPLVYPLSAQKRRNIILGKMKHLNFITQDEYEQALLEKVTVKDKAIDTYAPYVKEMVRTFMEDAVGRSALYRDGLLIKTTINKKMQTIAQQVFVEQMVSLKKELGDDLEGAMVVIDRRTGEIKALVGGYDFIASKWNRAVQGAHQIGSTIKPLIYAVARQQGIHCTDTDIDEPFELVQGGSVWAPKNYNKRFNGQITLAYALSHSNNIVTIKTFLRLNPDEIVALAKKCGMKGKFHTYPSLALGCVDGTLLEVAGMFNIFANDGVYVEPHFISWVKDRLGKRIYKATPRKERVLDSATSGHVASVLALGPERLKKMYSKSNWINSQAIIKTGTTNDSRICWLVGSTPTLTTAVYVAFDDNRPMGDNIYPIKTAFPIWLAFNREIGSSERQFFYDASLHKVTINEYSGQPAQEGDPGAISLMV